MKGYWSCPLILLFVVILLNFTEAEAQRYKRGIVTKIENGKMFIDQYGFSRERIIDVSDLTLIDRIENKDEIFNTFYREPLDFRILLLVKGYAKLKNEAKAESSELEAQNKARAKKIGVWRVQKKIQPPSKTKSTDSKGINWNKLFGFLWNLVIVLGGFGILGWLAKKAYKKVYIQRKFKLLIIGEPSTGKTALLYNLVDPNVSRDTILQLTESKAISRKQRNKVIPKGKFEIIPELADVPGSAFASVWDSLLGTYNHALVMVVSPYRLNGVMDGTIKDQNIDSKVDQKYVDIQLGYVQAYIEGGIGAKSTKKPKVVIMFISKFDLYSKLHPGDSASQKAVQKIFDIFDEHIKSAKSAAKKAGIRFETIIGSSVEKWNTERVLAIVTDQLYKS